MSAEILKLLDGNYRRTSGQLGEIAACALATHAYYSDVGGETLEDTWLKNLVVLYEASTEREK